MKRLKSGLLMCAVLLAASVLGVTAGWAVHDPPGPVVPGLDAAAPTPERARQAEEVSFHQALVSLPFAAVLGAALAFRPQRRGTPPRNPAVIQTQIILTVVGALVMLVVGASLARAFGIVGAANLVRYRSKIEDPKDAGVMLCCLALGLASGVGIYWIAGLATLFILGVLWVLESIEPVRRKDFLLKIKATEPTLLQPGIEDILKRNHVKHELRTSSKEDLTYSVNVPFNKKTDQLTNAILALRKKDEMALEWSDKKPNKNEA